MFSSQLAFALPARALPLPVPRVSVAILRPGGCVTPSSGVSLPASSRLRPAIPGRRPASASPRPLAPPPPAAAAAAAAAAVATPLALVPAHGYVALSLLFAVFVHQFYMVFRVGSARKKFGVPYPALYATGDDESSKAFNCVQRGHQNSLESYPGFLALLLVAGVGFPLTAAISGAVYSLGKVVYFNGYATGDPNKRLMGSFSYFGLFTLMGCVARLAVGLIS